MNAAAANVQKSKAYTNTWCIGIPPPPPPNLIHSWLNLHNSDISNNNSNVISITPLGTKSTRRRILWTNWLTYYRHNTYILAYTSIFLHGWSFFRLINLLSRAYKYFHFFLIKLLHFLGVLHIHLPESPALLNDFIKFIQNIPVDVFFLPCIGISDIQFSRVLMICLLMFVHINILF